jgi:DNA-binding MarR family transcriptional regulator
MLGVAGFTGRGWASISELADFLQERHNAVVTLVQRCEKRGLIRKQHGREDYRVARVSLTTEGSRILRSLTRLHRRELERFEGGHLIVSNLKPIAGERQEGRSIGQSTQSPEK